MNSAAGAREKATARRRLRPTARHIEAADAYSTHPRMATVPSGPTASTTRSPGDDPAAEAPASSTRAAPGRPTSPIGRSTNSGASAR